MRLCKITRFARRADDALCGGAFLSAYLYVAALLFAALTCANASRSEALKIAALATAMFLAGLAFFNAVLPTLAS